jgi:hypothetical protein
VAAAPADASVDPLSVVRGGGLVVDVAGIAAGATRTWRVQQRAQADGCG